MTLLVKENGVEHSLLTADDKIALLKSIYPNGSIYQTTSSDNPNTILGFGTWEQITGKFLFGTGSSSYTSTGQTGGYSTVTLTTSQIPNHTHTLKMLDPQNGANASKNNHLIKAAGFQNRVFITTSSKQYDSGSTGGGGAHNNIPPYYGVNTWYRQS